MNHTIDGPGRNGGAARAGPALSNYASDLAERAGQAFRRGAARSIEAAESYLEAGALLCELKDAAGHGAWTAALARAGIAARTAQRLMRLQRAGLTAAAIAEAGGIAAADAALSGARGGAAKNAIVADLDAGRGRRH